MKRYGTYGCIYECATNKKNENNIDKRKNKATLALVNWDMGNWDRGNWDMGKKKYSSL